MNNPKDGAASLPCGVLLLIANKPSTYGWYVYAFFLVLPKWKEGGNIQKRIAQSEGYICFYWSPVCCSEKWKLTIFQGKLIFLGYAEIVI